MNIEQERYGETLRFPPWIYYEHLARFEFAAKFVRGKIVADCASGSGFGSNLFAVSGSICVDAVDISAEAITAAALKYPSPIIHFRQGSATELPIADSSVDVYVSLETIEHIEDDQKFLAEACRILKPDGLFICSTPNRRHTNPGKTLTDKPWNKFHVREYSDEEFEQLLSHHFSSIEKFGQNPTSHTQNNIATWVASYLSPGLAVRINQVVKLLLIWRENKKRHAVLPVSFWKNSEYMIAVARNNAKNKNLPKI